jgi:hypothetical protein
LYWDFVAHHPDAPVPDNVYSGKDAEQSCVDFQCTVLKSLGLSEDVLEAYGDLGDSRYWEVPWELRDW